MTPLAAGADILYPRSKENYLDKMRHFDRPHQNDVYVPKSQIDLFKTVTSKIKRVKRTVGYANFGLISFDQALRVARNYSYVGRFTKEELNFLEAMFYRDAQDYGFFGKKVLTDITASVSRKEVIKIKHSGQYLYKDQPLQLFIQIKDDIGESIVLTSGIRSIVKQMDLFFNKTLDCNGNLSLASRSLAPAGYSYHGIGDFDVGKVGYGTLNFTSAFAKTREFKQLMDLGYVSIRYVEKNLYGVQFEPWHIKVV